MNREEIIDEGIKKFADLGPPFTRYLRLIVFSEMDTVTSTSDTSGKFLVQTVSGSYHLASVLRPNTC